MTFRDVSLGNAAGQPGNDFSDGTVSQTMKFLKTMMVILMLAAAAGLLGACGGAGEPLPTPSQSPTATATPQLLADPTPGVTQPSTPTATPLPTPPPTDPSTEPKVP